MTDGFATPVLVLCPFGRRTQMKQGHLDYISDQIVACLCERYLKNELQRIIRWEERKRERQVEREREMERERDGERDRWRDRDGERERDSIHCVNYTESVCAASLMDL